MTTAWISLYTDPDTGIVTPASYGECAASDYELPPDSVDATSLPLPAPLSTLVGDWPTAFESGLVYFYQFSSPTELVPRPVNSLYEDYSLYDLDPPYGFVVDMVGYPTNFTVPSTELNYAFLTQVYANELVAKPVTWDDLKKRGENIINTELAVYATTSQISGNPVPTEVVNVQNVCLDPSAYYDTPDEAIQPFRGGAAGIALSLGGSWPPPIP